MCDKAIPENGGMLKSVPDCYKNQQRCDPDCYKTQNMCDKAVNTSYSFIQFVPECCKIQDKAVNRH